MVNFEKERTRPMAAPKTLGLDDDLDGVEIAQSLEASFGAKFSNKEAEDCRTVGDIFTLLQSHLVRDHRSSSGCASAMAFYRLRRTVAKLRCTRGGGSRIPREGRMERASRSPRGTFVDFEDGDSQRDGTAAKSSS
jgi:hypothetical protein